MVLSILAAGQARAAAYTFTTINDPAATNSTYARGINDVGQVVGY
jgi:hypothetical protein